MLDAVVTEAARRFGDAPAFVTADGWPLSYAALDRLSDEVAVGLHRRGVGVGDVIALLLPAGPEFVVAYAAAAKLGAVTAGVNERLAPPERVAVLDVADPKLVLATAALTPDGGGASQDGGDFGAEAKPTAHYDVMKVTPAECEADVLAEVRARGETPVSLPPDRDRAVAIMFTSGTTGLPKGAVYAERQLEAIAAVDVGGQWGGGGRALAGQSLVHVGFMSKLPGTLQQGGTTYFVRRWRAAEALELIARHRLTSTGGIPTQVALMLQVPDFDRHDLSSVRAIVMGGGPSTAALVQEARRRFHAPVAVRFSCTESGVGLGTELDDPDEDAEVSVGRPRPGIALTIRAEDDRILPVGEVGEVCLRSAATMSGYYRDPAATAAAFTRDGAVRTGDLGWVDDRGRLRLAGRSKEMYVRGGYNVYPLEVENVLAGHPNVTEVAVVPRPDEVMGEIGVAAVVPRDARRPPTLDELRAYAAPHLAAHKLPEALLLADALPRTAMEKLDRRALERAVDHAAGEGSGVEPEAAPSP